MLVLPHAVTNAERLDNMQKAVDRGFPFVKKVHEFRDDAISIVAYGPSLQDTWRDIQPPIMTVSGAHDYLVSRGIVPNFHVDIDPRPHKAQMLLQPQDGTRYLMASVCHPDFWDVLETYDVELWHLVNGNDYETIDWVGQHHPAGTECLIGGGSTAGQRAFNVAASVLGYRKFNVYGMDCSYTHLKHHAGNHTGKDQPIAWVTAGPNGRQFRTTPQLVQAAQEMQEFLQTMNAEIIFYGDGLMQELARVLKQQRKGKYERTNLGRMG